MWYNGLVVALLKSPLHGLVSNTTAVVGYTGRKSGKRYQTPVNYARVGERVLVTSFAKRKWWRNLQDGAAATVRLAGKEYQATGQAYAAAVDVRRLMGEYLHAVPQQAKYFSVGTLPDGRLNEADIDKLTAGRVMVEFHLTEN